MTPSVVTGPIAADPEPGTPAWDNAKRQYDKAVVRAAKLRQYEAELPAAIRDAEDRVRVLAQRLGLPSASGPTSAPNGRRARQGQTRARILDALRAGPATRREIAERAGTSPEIAGTTLCDLRTAGLAAKDPGYGAPWRLTDQTPEGG